MFQFSPDGRYLAYATLDADDSAGQSVLDTATLRIALRVDGGAARRPWFSPDSRWLLFATQEHDGTVLWAWTDGATPIHIAGGLVASLRAFDG